MLSPFLFPFAALIADAFDSALHIVGVILGGLVLWLAVLVVRWCVRSSSFRRRR